MSESDGVASRVISILWTLCEGATSVSLRQIAQRSNIPAPTAHRILAQLTALGIVGRAPHRRYRIGSAFYFLSSCVVAKMAVADRARPILQDIVRRSGSACLFSLYLPSQLSRAVVVRIEPSEPVRHRFRIHEPISLTCGAGGRSILACLDSEQIERAIGKASSRIDRGALLDDIDATRKRGYAVSYGEVLRQNIGLAVAVVGVNHEVLGNIALVMPRTRWTLESEIMAANVLMHARDRLANALHS